MTTTAQSTSKSTPNDSAHDLDPAGGKAKAKPKAAGAGVSHAKRPALPPPQVISEIHLIPLERIEVAAQVRTEFDEASIAELAADIEAHGLLQPVLANPIGDEKYRLVCGERRLRAIRLLGQKVIPAVITKMSDQAAKLAQFAENVQREDMSLKDQARAIRAMFDELGSLDAVAGMVKKSKAWVSKRVAVTMENFFWTARNLMENGDCEDIEILGTINQVEKQLGYNKADDLASLVKNKKYTRQQCRDWLKEEKEKREAEKAATQVAQAEEKQKPKAPPPPPVFNAQRELARIERECEEYDDHKPDANKILAPYTEEEQARILNELDDAFVRGRQARESGNAIKSIIQFTANRYGEVLEHTAFLHGYFDSPFELANIIENAFHTEE